LKIKTIHSTARPVQTAYWQKKEDAQTLKRAQRDYSNLLPRYDMMSGLRHGNITSSGGFISRTSSSRGIHTAKLRLNRNLGFTKNLF